MLLVAACGNDDDKASDSTKAADSTSASAASTASSAAPSSSTGSSTGSSTASSAPSSSTGSSAPAEQSKVKQGLVGPEDKATPVKGGTLNFAVYAWTSGLDPAVSTGSGTSGGIELGAIYDELMKYDITTGKYEPQLAESLESDAEGKVWTLKLKANTKFTDGTPLDAAAVEFSLKRHLELKSRHAGLVANIETYEVKDPQTLVMTLKSPWTGFPFVLAYGPGQIVSPTAVQKQGNEDFNKNPVGAGPFMLERYAPGEEIILKANPEYVNGAPNLDGVRFSSLNGAQAVLDGLNSGDIGAGFIREAAVAKKALDADYRGALTVQNLGAVILMNQGRNDKDVITRDVRVRKAIALATNPVVIDQRTDQGTGYPTKSLFGASSKWETKSSIEYNLEEAKKLVDEVKKEKGWDGSIKYSCINAPTRITQAVTFAAMLDAAGFKTTIDNNKTIGELTAQVQVQGEYELACWGMNAGDDSPYIALSQHLASTSPGNASGYKNPDFDALIGQLRTVKDAAEEQAVLNKLQELADKDIPTVPYGAVPELVAFGKNTHGIVPTVKSQVLLDKAFITKG